MIVLRSLLIFILAGILFAAVANAHESRPGYLQLNIDDSENVRMLFKAPAVGNMRFGLYPNLPANCAESQPPSKYIIDGAYTERGLFRCDGGITDQTVSIDGLSRTLTDVLVRVERADGSTQVARLTPSAPSFVVVATPAALAVAGTYLAIGFEHILLGIDHLLFVLALLIIVKGTRKLIWTITAFTIAHSLTLAAATLGLLQVPQAPVEAVIALSIVFVASEIIHVSQGRPGAGTEQAVDRRVYIRSVARLWFCRRAYGGRSARASSPSCTPVLQRRCGAWSARVRCRYFCGDVNRQAIECENVGLDRDCGGLLNRYSRVVLDDPACGWLLELGRKKAFHTFIMRQVMYAALLAMLEHRNETK